LSYFQARRPPGLQKAAIRAYRYGSLENLIAAPCEFQKALGTPVRQELSCIPTKMRLQTQSHISHIPFNPWAWGGLRPVFWLHSKGRFRRSHVLFQNVRLPEGGIKAESWLLVLLLFISRPYITDVFEPICKRECMGIL